MIQLRGLITWAEVPDEEVHKHNTQHMHPTHGRVIFSCPDSVNPRSNAKFGHSNSTSVLIGSPVPIDSQVSTWPARMLKKRQERSKTRRNNTRSQRRAYLNWLMSNHRNVPRPKGVQWLQCF
ncbi:hypothetical protein BofuT4_P014990.1 [Botrytis cinerea T4]|uniref:Uncharacterized protein n=1 Tax=Botryotinia fuckeliana (strain T4) TaxID=999810 RepID=G2XNB5_BOTF4|nr:hypothetical protein BofuT4_P014990.1 [Botrytis cinerea T4]